MNRLALLFLVAAGCTSNVRASSPPPAAVVQQPTTPVKPQALVQALPPNGQVIRDAQGEILGWVDQLRDHMRPVEIVRVEPDKYEKDSVVTTSKMKLNSGTMFVFAEYQRRGGFWKLVAIDSRIQ